ncbi:Ig-like domain-containing protein [Microbacterium sp. ARD31]|uniref:Ig-like domain-containing protein n=1 Tax=Microbacterium sp. ARD31 TaxID=2962576 RepID=UPI002881033D|nr:Ig-like domain-containing protein [Microbacterium sp. ARD31]MDT0185071.1 Ig-like domain-containing protein [Microbacterium sp. ARD31]
MRRRTLAGVVAGTAALAVVIVAGVVWPGLDARETPDVDTAVWALQTGDGRRYARVNTAIGELDTVRSISNPSQVVHGADGAFLFSDSFSKLVEIDPALPVDLDDEALRDAASTPAGTTDVVVAGDFVAYRTDAGTVFAGRLADGGGMQVEPFPESDEDAPAYVADAIAVDERGVLLAYSSADGSVIRYDIPGGALIERDAVAASGLTAPAVTGAGAAWVLVDTDDGDVWTAGSDAAVAVPSTGTVVVSEPATGGDAVYLADETSLVRVATDGSGAEIVTGTGTTVLGTPARPIVHDGEVFAAWVAQGALGGVLWSSRTGPSALDYGDEELPDDRRPVFVESGSAVILNETRTGWVWTVPDGALVPSSQDWSLDDRTDPEAVPSDEQLSVVIDPKPPIAEPDAFGVRAGALASLPVLMNDHDPNEDVLAIDPESVTGLDPGFGVVTITDDGQRLAVRVLPGASGSASFSYAVTDGTSAEGLRSEPARVTLTVSGGDANAAPEWCGVERCLVQWPEPEVARGGTVTVPVLPGWVDPDGDPLLLLSVDNPSGIGSVAASPAGDVVYQHSDDGGGGEQLVELAVTVADTAGATAVKPLVIRVSPEPALAVQSFAVVDTVDSGLTVDVAAHVTGTAGTLSLESVRVLDDAAVTATVVGGSTAFDVVAREPGSYRVGFTVTDGTADASGTVRITILDADAPAQLATSPVVAFVHPQEDATLDVFAAVSNPTRRVLLLSDVVAHPDAGATLSVDAVAQNHLRVSGSTASGAAGRLGTVTYAVGDGTEDAGARVEGEATVYLLPPAPELAPIAVDDRALVRAGAQIDIPVLDNDIAPAGGTPLLDPASVASSSSDALAFGSGGVLRYLAPSEPGDYTVEYAISTVGSPSLVDTATVRITVLDDEANRAPLPDTLEGRVLSGQSTLIEFDGYGADPDGDVVALDRIVSQPDQGAATISADGASILYTGVPGASGQVSFRYRVVDALGATGEGTVRIGVLDAQSNPSPVTYTDYVQVQAGAESVIRVSPLANDVDPTMGELVLTDVRPDLPAALEDGSPNPEHTRLAARIRSVDDTMAVIAAGEQPGTMSFLYDVESSSGNTGRGLIVVRVVRESVPDHPVVTDTVLTAETREQFPSGVDVLDGHVSWSGGDPADLRVSLWGEPDDVAVDGVELSGPLPDTTRIVPFAVTGEASSGEVTTYAFLRIPGDEDLALALRSDAEMPKVTELQSVDIDMAALVAAPRGSTIEVGPDPVASGARAEGTCAVVSATTVRYDAGAGAPWTDSCRVPVRLAGQEDWTYLSVPILIRALDPQPELRAASLTVGPGETATYDLRDMTRWQLRSDWDAVSYAVSYEGTAFEVTQRGSTVTVTGADRALPGAEELATVSVTSHPDAASARLILRVGAAPSVLPRGGTVERQCSQAAGSSCVIEVVGAAGEVNPLPGTPLELADVRATGSCVGVSFRVASPTAVAASWEADAPGASCTAAFSVRDAQQRRTNGERDGRVTLDLLGFPKAPASIAQTGYGDGTLTLRVDPGPAREAYPALTGFVVRSRGDVVARCAPDGSCPTVSAPNGEEREYTAVAVNAVGESRSAVRTTGWAYDPPASPTAVTARAVVTSSGDGGIVALRIEGIDTAQTGSVEITSATGETVSVPVGRGDSRLDVPAYRVGTNSRTTVTVTPVSRFTVPPGLAGTVAGAGAEVQTNGIGRPLNPQLTLSSVSNGDGTSTVTARGTATLNGDGSSLRYGIVRDGLPCLTSPDGETATFANLPDGEEYRYAMCVESHADGTSFGRATTTATVQAQQSGRAPRGWTFVVDSVPNVAPDRAEWVIRAQPTTTERIPNNNEVEISGGPPTTVFGTDPGIQVRYVHRFWSRATPWATVVPAAGSAPYQVQARWWVESCVGGGQLLPRADSSNDPTGAKAAVTFGNAALRYYDASGALLPHTPDTWTVPVGAASVEGIAVTANWNAQGWGLAPVATSFSASCTPNLPPDEPGPPADPQP